jgi:hypothetical protein
LPIGVPLTTNVARCEEAPFVVWSRTTTSFSWNPAAIAALGTVIEIVPPVAGTVADEVVLVCTALNVTLDKTGRASIADDVTAPLLLLTGAIVGTGKANCAMMLRLKRKLPLSQIATMALESPDVLLPLIELGVDPKNLKPSSNMLLDSTLVYHLRILAIALFISGCKYP